MSTVVERTARAAGRLVLALMTTLGLSAGAAMAGSLTPIPSYADSSTRTEVWAISNTGWMTGSIDYPDGSGLGFVRNPTGVYTTFSSDFFTQGRGVNDYGDVAGFAIDSTGTVETAFERASFGLLLVLKDPADGSNLYGQAQGISNTEKIVGDFFRFNGAGSTRYGFVSQSVTITDIVEIPGTGISWTAFRGFNDNGVIVGHAADHIRPDGTVSTDGIVYRNGSVQKVVAPGAAYGTFLEDINNHGLAVGQWNGADFHTHSFTYNVNTGKFTEIKVPGANNVVTGGINDLGQVVITTDITGGPNNFIYQAPVPEPAAWALMLTGLFGLGVAIRRRRAARFA